MPTPRVSRGRKTQELLADWFRRWWKSVESRPASLPGTDLLGMPGWAIEVKATEGQDFTGALRQARKNAFPTDYPVVIYRPRGYGPDKIGKWVVAMDLDTFTSMAKRIEGFDEP